ncbi:NAD(P)/FAD-dependent oxidoreductase [Aliamphritea hakodatensis]|uniref:NAD(P)/FAD-dependent oxidoreductase n=1 Tax=Aliamphritea hakodatensis TaxID=2895352 RepID=UPI0022FD3C03|nr:FAD-binding oxidoreductase [Aliamphritea hakodatensis]
MSNIYDIAIIGGGIAGASLAYALNGQRSVVLLEQESALGYHSTGRSAAEFTRRFHSEKVGLLTSMSETFMHSPPEGFSDVPLLRPRGNLLIANAEKHDHLLNIFANEQANTPEGVSPVELLSVSDACDKVPFLNEEWLSAAFYDPDCWDVEVENLLQGYIRGAKSTGTDVLQNTGIRQVQWENDHWIIEAEDFSVRARTVVNATGGWADATASLFATDPLQIIPHRRTAISVKVPDYSLHDMPEVNEIDEVFYFKPDAGQLMVSPADETPVDPHDAWPEELDIAYAAHYLSECSTLDIQHVAHSWAGLRTFAKDRLPVIGYSGQTEGFFWLAGLGGYGIQTSPAVGQLAAAQLLNTPAAQLTPLTHQLIRQFTPARFEN